jgi:hypothetical protein
MSQSYRSPHSVMKKDLLFLCLLLLLFSGNISCAKGKEFPTKRQCMEN